MTDPLDTHPYATPGDTPLDQLVAQGFAPGDDQRERSIADLLSLLDLPPASEADRSLLINVTVARVARHRDDEARVAAITPERESTALTPESERILDEMERAGWSIGTEAGPTSLLSALELPDGVSDDERAALVDRTLGAIQSQIDRNQDRFRMDPARDRLVTRARLTLSDIASVAAMVLIAGAIFWPLVTGLRESSNERLCAQDLAQAGIGFALYANDHDDRLPSMDEFVQEATRESPWWSVGETRNSHSANLFELVRGGYASLNQLSCPGNEHAPMQATSEDQHDWHTLDEVSYSYQIFQGTPPRISSARNMVILADKSPIIARARLGEAFNPTARSLNHGGRGQNVLMNDLRVVFTEDPFKPSSNDNLWLPRHFEVGHFVPLTGTEAPADEVDAFVGP